MSFGQCRNILLCCLVIVSLGACAKGNVGEKISGETSILRGGTVVTVLRNPTDGGVLTSRYGKRKHPLTGKVSPHLGIDLAAPAGTPVLAAADGKLSFQGDKGSFGKYIEVAHNDHVVTSYAHLSKFEPGLSSGTPVEKGQVIGYIGTTGHSSGPHLHYEVVVDGTQTDPLGLSTGKIADDVNKGVEAAVIGVGVFVDQLRQSFGSGEAEAKEQSTSLTEEETTQ